MDILSLLTENEREYLSIIEVYKNQTIFLENSPCNNLSFLIEGEVEIVSYLFDGKEIIYQRIKKNGFFGNNLLFSSNNFYKGNVVAITNCKIALIKKEDFLNILSTNKKFLLAYLENTSTTSILLNQKIKLLSLDNATERVLYYLHIHDNKITYQSITSLAKEIAITRECMSRTLKKLVLDGKIIIKGKTILVY